MTDAMRSEFEEWAVSENYNIDIKFDSDSSCLYRSKLTQGAWIIWQACAARTVPEGCMVVNAKWLERHAGPEDHACVRCYPHSDMLVDGFSCYYHKALDVIAAAPEPKK